MKKPKGHSYDRNTSRWFKMTNHTVRPEYKIRLNRIIIFNGELFRLLDKFAPKTRIIQDEKDEYVVSKEIKRPKDGGFQSDKVIAKFIPGMGRGTLGKFVYLDDDHHPGNVKISTKNYFTVFDHDRCLWPVTVPMHSIPKHKSDKTIIPKLSTRDFDILPILIDHKPFNWFWDDIQKDVWEPIKSGIAKSIGETKEFLNEKHFAAIKILSSTHVQSELLDYHIEDEKDQFELASLLDHQITNLHKMCVESKSFQEYFKTYKLDALYLLIYEINEFYELNKHYSQNLDLFKALIQNYLDLAASLDSPFSPEEEKIVTQYTQALDSVEVAQKIKQLYLDQGMIRYAETIDEKWFRKDIDAYFHQTDAKQMDVNSFLNFAFKKYAPCDKNHLVIYFIEILLSEEFSNYISTLKKPLSLQSILTNLFTQVDLITSCSQDVKSSILVSLIENQQWEIMELFLKNFPDTSLTQKNKNTLLIFFIHNHQWENIKLLFEKFPDTNLLYGNANALEDYAGEKDDDLSCFSLFFNALDFSNALVHRPQHEDYVVLSFFDSYLLPVTKHFDIIKELIAEPYVQTLSIEVLGRIYVSLLENNELDLAEKLKDKRLDLYYKSQPKNCMALLEQKKYDLLSRLLLPNDNYQIIAQIARSSQRKDSQQKIDALIDSPLINQFNLSSITDAFEHLIANDKLDLAIKLLAKRPDIEESKDFSPRRFATQNEPHLSILNIVPHNEILLDFFIQRPKLVNQFTQPQIAYAITELLYGENYTSARQLMNITHNIDVNVVFDDHNFYPLHCAVINEVVIDKEEQSVDLVRFMCEELKPAARVNVETVDGQTPLDLAIKNKHFKIVRYFIETPALLAQFSAPQLGNALAYLNNNDLPILVILLNAQFKNNLLHKNAKKAVDIVMHHHDDPLVKLAMGLTYYRLCAQKSESKEDSRTHLREQGENGFALVKSLLENAKSVDEVDKLVNLLKKLEGEQPFLRTFASSIKTSMFKKDFCTWGSLMQISQMIRKTKELISTPISQSQASSTN